jgi:itaconyl-CoA hydratase
MSVIPGWQGRFFEDFSVGDVYPHQLGRTVTDADNIWFTCLTMNTNPIHFDANIAAKTEFGKILVNSCFTLSLVVGLSVSDLSQNVIANLQWTDVVLPHPVFAGDTIYARSTVLEKRESKSRPHAGIVTVFSEGFNQDGDIVISYKRTFLVYKKAAGLANRTPPQPRPAAQTPPP